MIEQTPIQLISLNIWGGQLRDELREFITKHAADTDIFCFQEVFNDAPNYRTVLGDVDINGYATLSELLPDHTGYYAPSQDQDEGLAMFIKPNIAVSEVSDLFVYRHRNAMINDDGRTIGRNIQYAYIEHEGEQYTVINFHGLWNGGGKTDAPERIEQSANIRAFIDEKAKGKVILIGDFNLEPDTESLAMLNKDMRNLIAEYGITSTRSYHYTKAVKYADYAIVSTNLNVESFQVLPDPVSDHLPLQISFL